MRKSPKLPNWSLRLVDGEVGGTLGISPDNRVQGRVHQDGGLVAVHALHGDVVAHQVRHP